MKAWITKYALTQGIFQVEGEICEDVSTDMFKYGGFHYAHGKGKEWHTTRESAIGCAEAKRLKKIASLRSQLARLEKLKVEIS